MGTGLFLLLFSFIGKQSLLSAWLSMAAAAIVERGWREREEKDTKRKVPPFPNAASSDSFFLCGNSCLP